MNVLTPMAGAGKRFLDVVVCFKTTIIVDNKPMIQLVLESLNFKQIIFS